MKVIQQKRGGIICRKGSLVAPSMLYFCVQIGVKGLLARSHAHKTLWMSRTQAQCWVRSLLFSRLDIAVTVFEHRLWWHKNLKPSRVPFDFTLYKASKMNIEFQSISYSFSLQTFLQSGKIARFYTSFSVFLPKTECQCGRDFLHTVFKNIFVSSKVRIVLLSLETQTSL